MSDHDQLIILFLAIFDCDLSEKKVHEIETRRISVEIESEKQKNEKKLTGQKFQRSKLEQLQC